MPQPNTQSYINGGANVRARASGLASSPEQPSKAATRFAWRWNCSEDIAQRAAAALVTESAMLVHRATQGTIASGAWALPS